METDCRFSARDSLEKIKSEEGLHKRPETIWSVARKTFLSAISYTDKENKPIIERIEALEAALAEVKTRGIRYCGVYQRAINYRPGDVISFDGSGWVFVGNPGEVKGAPGASSGWQLLCRGGRQ